MVTNKQCEKEKTDSQKGGGFREGKDSEKTVNMLRIPKKRGKEFREPFGYIVAIKNNVGGIGPEGKKKSWGGAI